VGERRGVYKILVGKPEGKRRRWEDNIKMELQEVGCALWSGSSWLRIGTGVASCECGNETSGSMKFLTS